MKIDIIQIQSLIDKKEFKKFGDFIRSPFFNTEPRFIRLYELIQFEGTKLTRETIAKKIFGENCSTSELRFRKLVSEFMKLFVRFTAQTEYDSSELTKRKMQLLWLRKKKDFDGYIKLTVDTDSYIKANYEKDEEYYLELTILFAKIYEFKDSGLDDSKNDFSFVINRYLDKYFISMKLFLYQRMDSLKYSANFDPEKLKTFEKSVFEYIETHKEELKNEHPEIYLRHIAILLDKNGFDRGLYDEYLRVLVSKESWVKINENGLLLTLLNIISKYINSGNNELLAKVLEIADLLNEKNIITSKGITYIDLKIIIEAAIRLKKFDWALEYMSKIKDHIKYENPRNAYDLLSAKILFFKNDFINARRLLSSISIDDYIFYCEAKLIEIRIAYLQSDLESVLQISDTAKKYIRSHKEIGKHFVEAYIYFIDFMKKLIDIQIKNNDDNEFNFKILILEKEIDSINSPCYAFDWIKEQVFKLKAGH